MLRFSTCLYVRPSRTNIARRASMTLAVMSVLVMGCSDPDRSTTHFCRQLQNDLDTLITPPATPSDVDQLVGHFKKLNKITPLAIEDEWQILTDLVEQASDVVLNDPVSRQELADAAYRAERPTRSIATWVETTCGFAMPDVIGLEGGKSP